MAEGGGGKKNKRKGHWKKPAPVKRVWGSHPGKERGSISHGEKGYLAAMERAWQAGHAAGQDPKQHSGLCPLHGRTEEECAYWQAGFMMGRKELVDGED